MSQFGDFPVFTYGNNTAILTWKCSVGTDCNASGDWTTTAEDVPGVVVSPQVLHWTHSFALYELDNGDIAILSRCDGASTWTSRGTIPTLEGFDDMKFAPIPGSATRVFVADWEGGMLHAALLANVDNTTIWTPVKWSVPIGDLCTWGG